MSDSLSLGVALLATWIAQLPASNQATFGYRRIEILAALVNGVGLVTIALWVAWEAVVRLQAPAADILSLPMLITAAIGLGVNSLNAFLAKGAIPQGLRRNIGCCAKSNHRFSRNSPLPTASCK